MIVQNIQVPTRRYYSVYLHILWFILGTTITTSAFSTRAELENSRPVIELLKHIITERRPFYSLTTSLTQIHTLKV